MNTVVKKILSILTPREKKLLKTQICLSLIISLLDIVFIGLILVVVSVYTGEIEPEAGFIPAELLNKNSLALVTSTLILFGLKNLAGYLIIKSQYRFVYRVAARISDTRLLNYLEGDYASYVHTDSSVNMRRISQEPIEFSHYVLSSFQQIITQGMLILFAVAGILLYNATLFVLLFLLLLPPVILAARLVRKKLGSAKVKAREISEKNIQYLQESLSAYIESNVYGKNIFFKDRYHAYQSSLNNYLADQQVIQALPSRLIEVFAVLGFFILILVNKFSEGEYSISLITIGVFIGASYKIIPGIVKILNGVGQIQAYDFTIDSLRSKTRSFTTISSLSSSQIKSIEFKRVRFNFDVHTVLNNFNLEISRGDFIGISGSSGEGKTTLLNLLLGFLDPLSGSVKINGMPPCKETREVRWSRIAYVKQQTFLIHDTVLKNITLSDATPDMQTLSEALRISGTDLLVQQLSNGLNEVIRENGKNLSGGQRQRVVLARALYKDFDLLVLDEPFSELDEPAESQIINELQLIARSGKMILLITHNRNSLSFCNKLIFL